MICWGKRLILGFLTAVVFVSGCKAQEKPSLSSSPLNQEQLSVYRGFLDKFSVLHFKNLSSVTVPFDFKGFPNSRPCLNGIELEGLSTSLRTAHRFGTEITEGRELKLVDPLAQVKLLQQQESPKVKEKSEPDSSFLTLSEVIFDTKHQFAILKYMVFCG